MTNYTDMQLSPSEAQVIEQMRRERPQGFVCEDGIVRCTRCIQTIIVKGDTSILPIEAFTPALGDGDDWCSDCDRDIKTTSPTPLVGGR